MKRFKKMMALVIVLVMTMMYVVPAAVFADGALMADGKISVSGIGEGDKVYVYQFISWTDGTGWVVDSDAGVDLDNIVDGLTSAELGTIASNKASLTLINSGGTVVTGGTYTNNSVAPGAYLILIENETNSIVYNPLVVSNDYYPNNPDVLALTDNGADAKKQPLTITKEADNHPDDYDVQVGDIVPFTIETNVPTYNTNWTNPTFKISDTLSNGLTIYTVPVVKVGGTEVAASDNTWQFVNPSPRANSGDKTFTVDFKKPYLQSVSGNPKVEITYSAIVGDEVKDTNQVHKEDNKVTLEFSNNPENENDHGTIDDETHHYTFAIDASRLGSGSGSTNELIKVGVDSAGNTLTVIKEGESWSSGVSPLQGAVFTLTGVGPNGTANGYTQTATSDENGRIFFNNLEVGTYTLQETSAPTGYVPDNTSHTIVISATYNDDTTLKDYTITIDGDKTAKGKDVYSFTSSEISSIAASPDNTIFPIGNTKGQELPSTGGIGTTMFYLIGAILVIGAGVILVTRRRVDGQQ